MTGKSGRVGKRGLEREDERESGRERRRAVEKRIRERRRTKVRGGIFRERRGLKRRIVHMTFDLFTSTQMLGP